MTGIKRRSVFAAAAGAVVAATALVAFLQPTIFGFGHSPCTEVALLHPAGTTAAWNRTVRSAQSLANSRRVDPTLVDRPENRQITLDLPARRLCYKAYAGQGWLGLGQQAAELCSRQEPPVAVVAGNNTMQAQIVARNLAASQSDRSPVLFITSGTTDGLMQVYPGKTFRVGYRNSVQAKTVVRRLTKWYAERLLFKPSIDAMIVDVKDNPFTRDICQAFRNELTGAFPNGVRFHEARLSTEGGSFEDPTEEENKLARSLVMEIVNAPSQPWVWVLPMGTDCFRRLQAAVHEAFLGMNNGQMHFDLARDNVTVLSGDSLGVDDFRNFGAKGLRPDATAATTIFFAHEQPGTESGATAFGVTGLAARILGEVLADLHEPPTPNNLVAALETWKVNRNDAHPFFENHERRGSGCAIVAAPFAQAGASPRFDIDPK